MTAEGRGTGSRTQNRLSIAKILLLMFHQRGLFLMGYFLEISLRFLKMNILMMLLFVLLN